MEDRLSIDFINFTTLNKYNFVPVKNGDKERLAEMIDICGQNILNNVFTKTYQQQDVVNKLCVAEIEVENTTHYFTGYH